MDKITQGHFFQNISTITLTRQHDKLRSMTITVYKYKKRTISDIYQIQQCIMYKLRKISKFLNYKRT